MEFEDYEPTEMDIEWTLMIVSLIQDGGLLAMPSSKLIYKLEHSHRLVTLINPEILKDENSDKVHRRAIRVFAKIGWYVQVQE